ncbi:MAG: ribosome maturation factor RimP [Nitrospirae bacterium]|nr:ribosome maturation factor RimP [Nitrospirota bacterium]
MDTIQEKVTDLAESLAASHGVNVLDVEIAGSMTRPQVRVFIDREGGVTLDDCAAFSRALSALCDVEDPIPTAYTLEVSSPGLDRPLKKLKHFEQSKGRLAKVVLKQKVDGEYVHIGRITDIREGVITLTEEEGKEVPVPFEIISRARLEIELK